jgi:tetratricopeptide (TPR) repeat protein
MGIALLNWGDMVSGAKGDSLLREAVAAFLAALKVRTRKTSPQHWATTQRNLGRAFLAQGKRMSSADGLAFIAKAIDAFNATLEVQKYETFPALWVSTQIFLGQALEAQGNFKAAASCYENILVKFPDDQQAHWALSICLTEKLHEYERSYIRCQNWLKRYPEDLVTQINCAENLFTTSRFSEFKEIIVPLMKIPEIPNDAKICLFGVEIANLLALNEEGMALAKIDTIKAFIAIQPEDFKLIRCSFDGSAYFISHNEKLAYYRNWILELFDALESNDRNTILTNLQNVRSKFISVEDGQINDK